MNDISKKMLIKNGKDFREIAEAPKSGGRPKEKLRTLEESKVFLNDELTKIHRDMTEIDPDNFLKDIYISIKKPNYYIAKSYDIESIYRQSGLERVGTGQWVDHDEKDGSFDVVRGNAESISSLNGIFNSASTKIVKREMDRIDGIDLVNAKEKIQELLTAQTSDKQSFELVFYEFNDVFEIVNKLNRILNKHINVEDFIYRKNIAYLNLTLTKLELKKLTQFNALRNAYSIYNGSLFMNDSPVQVRNLVHLEENLNNVIPTVGIIDGGVYLGKNMFFKQASQKYQVELSQSDLYVEHGSSVASAIMYGAISNTSNEIIKPQFKIESIRGLPSEQDDNYNLTSLENIIEKAIPKLKHIKIWNVSVGPVGPVLDEVVSSITALLDQLSFEYDLLFVIAAGNTGEMIGNGARLQSPADSVNNIAVNSFIKLADHITPALYNSLGPGREGGKLKPDLIAYGGSSTDSINTVSTYEYLLNKCFGTSFAAPMVTRKVAELLWRYPELDVWSARALVTHYCALAFEKGRHIFQDAKGSLPENIDDVVKSPANEFRIMYEGNLTAGSYVKLNLPKFISKDNKMFEITWTVLVKTPVDPSRPDAYTEYGIEDAFYPDADKYDYRKDKQHKLRHSGDLSVKMLLEAGFKQSEYPAKENSHYIKGDYDGCMDEASLRIQKLKWDTIKSQKIKKQSKSLNHPFFRLHAVSRKNESERIHYVLILSIKVKNNTNLYEDIMAMNQNLLPLTLRNELQDITRNKV